MIGKTAPTPRNQKIARQQTHFRCNAAFQWTTSLVFFFPLEDKFSETEGEATMSSAISTLDFDFINGLLMHVLGTRSFAVSSTCSVWSIFVQGSFSGTDVTAILSSSTFTHALDLCNGLQTQDPGTRSFAFFKVSFKL